MKLYPKDLWRFAGIMESDDNIYKYTAILVNKETEKLEQIRFGYIYDTHFFDTTGLNTYSHLNNKNITDRNDYIISNKNKLYRDYYNRTYFELKYLYDYF